MAALEANDQDFTYGRLGTPTVRALEEAIAELEGGHRTLLTPSGLSAIATALLAFVSAGDEVLVADSVYRPTRRFCDHVLKRLGVKTTYYDPLIGGGIDKLITKKTKVVFAESPGSQTFEVQDIPAIAKAAHDARRRGHSRQHLGDAALLQAVRPRRRRVDPGRHEIYRAAMPTPCSAPSPRPSRPRPQVAKAHDELGLCAGPEDVYLGLAGLAQPRRAAGAAPENRGSSWRGGWASGRRWRG